MVLPQRAFISKLYIQEKGTRKVQEKVEKTQAQSGLKRQRVSQLTRLREGNEHIYCAVSRRWRKG